MRNYLATLDKRGYKWFIVETDKVIWATKDDVVTDESLFDRFVLFRGEYIGNID